MEDVLVIVTLVAATVLLLGLLRRLLQPGPPPPFVRYRPPAPLDASGWTLVVDGSNLSYRAGVPKLEHLDAVLAELSRRFDNAAIRVFCDANLRYKFSGDERNEFISRVRIGSADVEYVETHGKSADEVLLQFAQSTERTIVVSNDRFDKDDDERRWRAGVPILRVSTNSSRPRPAGLAIIYSDERSTGRSVLVSRLLKGSRIW